MNAFPILQPWSRRWGMIAFVISSILPPAIEAAEPTVDPLLNQAQAASLAGESAKAIELATQAIKAAPTNAQCYYVRGRLQAGELEHAKAIADFDQALKLESRAPEIYQLRGIEHFKVGHIKESVADFEKFIEFAPARRPHHWQLGISYYYAGQYEKGRKLFELHQTVNPQDVENAVWHYLCVARLEGVPKARAGLIPIAQDTRVPMKQIHELFAGRMQPAEVLEAVDAGAVSAAERIERNFYAHLYIGLFYEAAGQAAQAREHIEKAAGAFPVKHYMGDVARVHAQRLRAVER